MASSASARRLHEQGIACNELATAGLEATENLWAVVPAGGSGTRLWPLSRAARPKFLLPLLGERSLLQQTLDRLAPSVPPERTLVVCGPAHAAPVARQLPALPERNVLVEPSPRGSGPAIALATALIARRDPAAIVGSFAADHEVSDLPRFDAALRTAIAAAGDGWLVTIGLTPTRPETGYGYIERSEDVVAGTPEGSAYRATRFVEKPDAADSDGVCRLGSLPVEREHVRLASPDTARRSGAAAAGPARRREPHRPGVGHPGAGAGRRRRLVEPGGIDDRPGRARTRAVA